MSATPLPHAFSPGLSPRVRGNPLYARFMRALPCARRATWVYPRVCGGTATGASGSRCAMIALGLSPRVRGNLAGQRRNVAVESAGEWTCRLPVGVYPRVCGGTLPDSMRPPQEPREQGLSPRVRGNRLYSRTRVYPRVCAQPFTEYGRPVYPRVCGGTHDGVDNLSRVRCTPGSIPACAGEPVPAWPEMTLRLRAHLLNQ